MTPLMLHCCMTPSPRGFQLQYTSLPNFSCFALLLSEQQINMVLEAALLAATLVRTILAQSQVAALQTHHIAATRSGTSVMTTNG